jgi:hypothetical protein
LRAVTADAKKKEQKGRKNMTAEALNVMLTDMQKETEKGKLKWRLEVATSEYRDPAEKPTVEADGEIWTVDECYTAYNCEFRGEEFSMITYENIETAGEKTRSTNLVFLPPLAMRIFRLDELAPYAVETSAVLADRIHHLWETLLDMYSKDKNSVGMEVREMEVSLEAE